MRDSLGSNDRPLLLGPTIADIERRSQRSRQSILLVLSTAAAVLICSFHAAVAGLNTVRAAGIGYLCLAVVYGGCALAFWSRARSAEGTLRVRWLLIAGAALSASVAYAPSFAECSLNTAPIRTLPIICFNLSEALYMLATVLFFAGVARSIVIVDMLQALLFVVLRFNLTYSQATRDHFAIDHLVFGQLVALFLFVIAIVACLGAASRAESQFLRTLCCFFGLRLAGFFMANQVCYTWFHDHNCGLWDVPGPALLAGFGLYVLYTSRAAAAEGAEVAPLNASGVVVRNLMPSFLAMVNLVLGLFLLRVSLTLAASAISVSLVCYVVRTVLLQAQAVHEKSRLERRNEHLEGLAVRDPLTGIGNRRSLAGAYSRLQASAGGESLSLLLIDIDCFKEANDRHGHLHGDNVLIALARRLEGLAAAVAGSHCARLGGDEFALLLPGVSAEGAAAMGEALRGSFGSRAFESTNSRVSVSIGIASLRAAGDLPLETLVCYADKGLYRAKLQGRNRVEAQPLWEPGIEAAELTGTSLRLELQRTAG